MNSSERRIKIIAMLAQSESPLSASAIAETCGVSRQIIVGDIALLRAAGENISATPRGYILSSPASSQDVLEKTIACRHDQTLLADELYTVVDNGGTLLDVTVEHPVYGQISGALHISSRYDADTFLAKIESGEARQLSELTNGIHLHAVRCKDEEAFQRILNALSEKKILLENQTE